MKYSTLYDLIKQTTYNAKLHISVTFYGDHGNEYTALPREHEIHAMPVCSALKKQAGGYARCRKCRAVAVRKAINEKKPFGGFCFNGVWEYIHPVFDGNDILCIISVGNILNDNATALRALLGAENELFGTMERSVPIERCKEIASLIESYTRMLLSLTPAKPHASREEALAEKVKRFIDVNFEYPLSAEELADFFHYNPKYLGRLFKQQTGMRFREYQMQKRLERGKELLEQTTETVVDIAFRLGFQNVTYFNRLFKEAYSLSPSAYRRKHKRG